MDRILHELINIMNETNNNETYHNLARFLIENIDKIVNMNITEIADLCYVSSATISRFCRELGFHNFTAFKSALEENYGFEIDYDDKYINNQIPITQKIEHLQKETINSLLSINNTLNIDDLLELAKLIHDTKNVAIFSQSHYQFFALYLQQRLSLFNKIVYIDVGQRKQLSRAEHLDENSLAIIYSPRGQSFVFSQVSNLLMQNKTNTILITQNELISNKSRYSKIINIGGTNENNLGLISYSYFLDHLILIYYNLYHDELIV